MNCTIRPIPRIKGQIKRPIFIQSSDVINGNIIYLFKVTANYYFAIWLSIESKNFTTNRRNNKTIIF